MVEVNNVREAVHHGTGIPVKTDGEGRAEEEGSCWRHFLSLPSPHSGWLS